MIRRYGEMALKVFLGVLAISLIAAPLILVYFVTTHQPPPKPFEPLPGSNVELIAITPTGSRVYRIDSETKRIIVPIIIVEGPDGSVAIR